MRYAVLAAVIGLLLCVGWAVEAAMSATAAPAASGTSAAPAAPIKGVPPAAPLKTSDVTPPAPLPDFQIPAIPEVGTDPYKAGIGPARTAPADVIEEGKRLFNREGRLEMDPLGRSMFAFNSGDKPMYLLENSWREYLEKVTDQGTKKARWRVSGIITVYGGRNYLLLTKLVHVLPEEENR